MVSVSKTAIRCPSLRCDFAYFASSPDPAGKLRSHFNNLKVRDADHESFFQKPFCVFCGDAIISKTRKGLWKSGMNKHWLLSHPAEFAEHEDSHEQEEMEIAVMLSPSQLDLLRKNWQLDFDLEEGDLITRRGKSMHLSRNIVIARTAKQDFTPSIQHQSMRREQIQSVEVLDSAKIGSKHQINELSDPATTHKRSRTSKSLADNELCPGRLLSSHHRENQTSYGDLCDKCGVEGNLVLGTSTNDFHDLDDPESCQADAFAAMTFCFPGFQDDMSGLFEDGQLALD